MRPDQAASQALRERVEGAVRALGLAGQRVLAAVSGGVDSCVMAHVLSRVAEGAGFTLCIGHVNHGLRGEASDRDERFVAAFARRLGLPVASQRVDPEQRRRGRSSLARPTRQEAARELRYAALSALAQQLGAERIATAHHADDQAETVLLRLLRGSGPDGLGGIPERSPDGRIVRPMLGISRVCIEAYAAAESLQWREDASNASSAYARNRLRRDWIPGLIAEFNPQLLRAVGNLAEAQRRDSEWIAREVGRESAMRLSVEGAWLRIEAKDWDALPEALARRVVREALGRCGAARYATRVHLQRVLEFLGTPRLGKRIELPGDLLLICGPAGFRLGPLRGPGSVGPGDAC